MRIDQYQWICNRLAEIIERLPAKKKADGGSDRRCRWCCMVDCGTTGGNDHGSGFACRSDKCKLYEAMDCYVKAREGITDLDKRIAELNEALALAHAILAKMQPGKVACAAKRAAIKHEGNDPMGYIAGVLANRKN